MKFTRSTLARASLLALAALAAATATSLAPVPTALASVGNGPADGEDFARTVLATGLADPFEILVAPDGALWVTERTAGRVTRIDPATRSRSTLVSIPGVVSSGGQDGLLGMALEQGGKGGARVNAYLSYTYDGDPGTALDRRQRIVRYSYDDRGRRLHSPQVLIEGLLASDDHNSGRLLLGPDGKLYYTIRDRGNNQGRNTCRPIEAQRFLTTAEVSARDWTAYQGKTLRLNTNGSIPKDNPRLDGVRSHVWTFGHRNAQGLAFDGSGRLYSSEHGPKSDDELNLLRAGGNYGWPRIVGHQDDSAYVYGDWSARASGCTPATYDAYDIPDDVPQQAETAFNDPRLVSPVRTFYTVSSDHDFRPAASPCAASAMWYICYPTIAPSSLDHYASAGIPGWSDSLLMPTLKRGTLFRMPVVSGTSVGDPLPLFRSQNRYRDTAIAPGGRTIYVATDSNGLAEGLDGRPTTALADPGAILAFTFTG